MVGFFSRPTVGLQNYLVNRTNFDLLERPVSAPNFRHERDRADEVHVKLVAFRGADARQSVQGIATEWGRTMRTYTSGMAYDLHDFCGHGKSIVCMEHGDLQECGATEKAHAIWVCVPMGTDFARGLKMPLRCGSIFGSATELLLLFDRICARLKMGRNSSRLAATSGNTEWLTGSERYIRRGIQPYLLSEV